MRYATLFFTFFLSISAIGQISFNKVKHDFGELESYSPRYVDFVLTNNGNKQEWMLSIKKPFDVVYINSKQFIEPDSSIILRFQVNPKVKGRFSYDIDVFTSDRAEATKIKLSGKLMEIDQNNPNAFTACPTFNDRPGGRDPNKFDLTVVTIDKNTKKELSSSTVSLIQNGRPVWTDKTDKRGKIKKDATLGFSYFYATHEGYYPAELGAYINFKRNYIVVELEKDARIPPPLPDPIPDTNDIVVADPEPTPEPPEIVIDLEDHIEEDTSTFEVEVPPAFEELADDNFDETHFKPINVVFVLDVSSSMREADKMELMKYSLFQLTDMMRPQDKMGIVTYASSANVILKPTNGANKDKIKKQVEQLKAYGFTSGGTGIKLGFKQAKRGRIEGGINHVIVITDGAFNRNSDDYKRYVKRYAKKGIHMSVVGIKNKDKDKEEMIHAASVGGGHYVPIFKLADAQKNLKQEIRLLTFKH